MIRFLILSQPSTRFWFFIATGSSCKDGFHKHTITLAFWTIKTGKCHAQQQCGSNVAKEDSSVKTWEWYSKMLRPIFASRKRTFPLNYILSLLVFLHFFHLCSIITFIQPNITNHTYSSRGFTICTAYMTPSFLRSLIWEKEKLSPKKTLTSGKIMKETSERATFLSQNRIDQDGKITVS